MDPPDLRPKPSPLWPMGLQPGRSKRWLHLALMDHPLVSWVSASPRPQGLDLSSGGDLFEPYGLDRSSPLSSPLSEARGPILSPGPPPPPRMAPSVGRLFRDGDDPLHLSLPPPLGKASKREQPLDSGVPGRAPHLDPPRGDNSPLPCSLGQGAATEVAYSLGEEPSPALVRLRPPLCPLLDLPSIGR